MDAMTSLKAQTIVTGISAVTGVTPEIVYNSDNTASVVFSDADSIALRAWLETQLSKKSDVSIEFMPVALPIVLKKIGLPVLLLLGAVYLAGRFKVIV
jgi:hypothetical protein